MSNQNFTLCYKINQYNNNWLCESGFNSIESVDKKAFELINTFNHVDTFIYPFDKHIPNSIQNCILTMKHSKLIIPNFKFVNK